MATFNYKIKRRKVKVLLKEVGYSDQHIKLVNQIMPFIRGCSEEQRLKGEPPMHNGEIRFVTQIAFNNILNHGQTPSWWKYEENE